MKIIQFIIFGNVLISISAGTLTMGISAFYEGDSPLFYFLTVFFSTLFIYNFQRMVRTDEREGKKSERHLWLDRNKKVIYLLAVLGIIGSGLSYFLLLKMKSDLLFLFFIGILGVFYALKVLNRKALRDLPLIKIHIIALVWVLITSVWPLVRMEANLIDNSYLFIATYLFIIAVTIPFDIRDLSYDAADKLTFPQVFGVTTSKRMAIIFLLISFSVLGIANESFLFNPFYYISLIGLLLLILWTTRARKEKYFSGWIDGWIIFFGLMFWLASN
ncbi:MAG: hypothetical protein WED10_03760 [Brumimicrobium sp.]